MSVKKLSKEIQTIICSSNNISSYKKAVEELVYNSLDAKATSIAIRVHIQDNKIQIVDNGCGIAKKDSILLGQRYTTSKYVDLSTFKCAPTTYGYRGQSLSSIVEISKSVNITSRFESTEETWSKTFYKGKEQNLVLKDTRPSKGTTVEITEFLYNLTIQNKNINTLQELLDIKRFLEQLSLVHSNISITLRDDNKNELIFKMHKNRDIYQKFKTLFDIEQADIQELHVEKSEYKSVAYIRKTFDQITLRHWIFINKKFVSNRKLNKVVQCYFTKSLRLSHKDILVNKHSENNDHDNKKDIPFYVIFLSCPYYDYDISHTPKQSILEFKNWKQVNLLIEKLVKFYMGELKIKDTKICVQEKANSIQQNNTREKVQEIMKRILGTNSKKLGVSQMQHGIKGKLIKRKKKKVKNISISKVLPLKVPYSCGKRSIGLNITGDKVPVNTFKKTQNLKMSHLTKKTDNISISNIILDNKNNSGQAITAQDKVIKKLDIKENNNIPKKAIKRKADLLIEAFEKPPEVVKNRCNIIANEAENAIKFNNQRKQTVTINETVNYSNFVKNNRNISIRKRVGEILIHDFIPLGHNFTHDIQDIKNNYCRSSHDLLNTILGSQPHFKCSPSRIEVNDYNIEAGLTDKVINKTVPELTYQSHNYNSNEIENLCSHRNGISNKLNENEYSSQIGNIDHLKKDRTLAFLSKLSKDNFDVQESYKSSKQKQKKKFEANYKKKRQFRKINTFNKITVINQTDAINNIVNSSTYSNITSSNYVQNNYNKQDYPKNAEKNPWDENIYRKSLNIDELNTSHIGFTYTITSSNIAMNTGNRIFENDGEYTTKLRNEYCKKKSSLYYCETQNVVTNIGDTKNVIFVSESQDSNNSNNCDLGIEPINVCETILSSPDIPNDSKVLNRNILNDSLYNFSPFVCERQIESNNLNLQSNSLLRPSYCDVLTYFNVSYDGIHHESNKNKSADAGKNAIIIEECGESYNNEVICCKPVEKVSKTNNISQYIECTSRSQPNRENLGHYTTSTSLHPNNDIIYSNINSEDINQGFNQESTGNIQEIHMKSDNANENIENEVGYNITESFYFNTENDITTNNDKELLSTNTFNLRNRLSFLPKGMSPLFVICNSKNICDYNLEQEYFQNALYNNFVSNVQTNTNIYEAKVQNTKDATTKDIKKFNNRMEKDNASLTFSADSLKEGKVLGQVDNKFIATILKGQSDSSCYLVLFDQHAVHERIRLEKNLGDIITQIMMIKDTELTSSGNHQKDYCNGSEWRSVMLDGVPFKLSKDEIMYLHNYKEKFTRFGLQWTNLYSNEIKLQAIPLAILGQNPREVEKVMTAVKNLISEEINNIRTQKGCVSMYPKTIMDLVCNEACRYAIMFGDTLSKNECVELLASLSSCKMPFQCAHGRPVMAVLMDIKSEAPKYEITTNHIMKLKANLMKASLCKTK